MSTTYIGLDIETTGLVPREGQILEVAAVGFVYDGETYTELGRFERVIKRDRIIGDPYAIRMAAISGLLSEVIGAEDSWREGASRTDWEEWLHRTFGTAKPHPIGKSVEGFDVPWLKYHGWGTPFSHRCVDVGTLYFDFEKGPEGLNRIAKKIGTPLPNHRAMQDVEAVIELFKKASH